jgi:hypothetical protein
MTFKTKTILVLVLAAALPVSVAGTLVIRGFQEEMTEKIDSFHNRIAALTASGIEDFLSDTLRSLMLSTSIIPWEQFSASGLRLPRTDAVTSTCRPDKRSVSSCTDPYVA